MFCAACRHSIVTMGCRRIRRRWPGRGSSTKIHQSHRCVNQNGKPIRSKYNLAANASIQIESLPTRSDSEAPLQNVLSISTAGKNRYLLHFNSHHSLIQWTAGIRLATNEAKDRRLGPSALWSWNTMETLLVCDHASRCERGSKDAEADEQEEICV